MNLMKLTVDIEEVFADAGFSMRVQYFEGDGGFSQMRRKKKIPESPQRQGNSRKKASIAHGTT